MILDFKHNLNLNDLTKVFANLFRFSLLSPSAYQLLSNSRQKLVLLFDA